MLTVRYDCGGSQGGRKWQCTDDGNRLTNCTGADKRLRSGAWYVEGVLEELDSPGDFYYDLDSRLLYLYPDREMCGRDDKSGPAVTGRGLGTKARASSSGCSIPDLIAREESISHGADPWRAPPKHH